MAIYDDAVIDAQKLREVAENAAKQQILESITPRIRQMINSRILGEQDELIDDEEGEEGEDLDDQQPIDQLPVTAATPPTPAPEKDSANIVINNTGDIHIGDEHETEIDEEPGDFVLTDQMAEGLARMIKEEKQQKQLQKRVDNLSENYRLFKEAVGRLVKNGKVTPGQKRKVRDTYRKLAQEAIALRGEVQVIGGGSQRLEGKLVETLKEMKTMSTKTKKNIFDFLFEGDDDKSEGLHSMEEAELVLSDEEVAGLADKDEDELADALSGLNFSVEAGDEDDEGDEGEDEDLDLDTGDEGDEGEEDEDKLDLGEMDEMGEGMHETVYEIDESALRRELGKMKNLRESRSRRVRAIRESVDSKADQFGGGEELGDVFYDVDEDSLINVLADELGSVSTKGAKNESVRLRKAVNEAAQYKQAAESLKTQLVEMNLFNAKLLYANKLMQNKDLTVKQQRAIVEALDNAKTLREAKLLYKSLSESLARRAQKSGNLSENANRTVLGSSSRSTRSAQPASSGVEVDRWAVLAGIPGGK